MAANPIQTEFLTDQAVREIVRRLVAEFAPQAIYLFGSYAYGTPTPASDIDLLVVLADDTAVTWELGQRADACLHGLGLPVELHFASRAKFERFRTVVGSFHREVYQRGRILYAA